ncbi:MAG: hypothetical protein EAZ55_13715 [Cytophagales bacterium]|nr:MAG: hypothetical protein EAZ55_13715 [Cytophagales bacterium]
MMMRYNTFHIFRQKPFTMYLWGFVCLCILNLSIDAPDKLPNYIPEDLSYNDQESLIEFIIEISLGFGDTILEYDDDDDTKESIFKKKITLDLFIIPSVLKQDNNIVICVKYPPYYPPFNLSPILQPYYSPPEFII